MYPCSSFSWKGVAWDACVGAKISPAPSPHSQFDTYCQQVSGNCVAFLSPCQQSMHQQNLDWWGADETLTNSANVPFSRGCRTTVQVHANAGQGAWILLDLSFIASSLVMPQCLDGWWCMSDCVPVSECESGSSESLGFCLFVCLGSWVSSKWLLRVAVNTRYL